MPERIQMAEDATFDAEVRDVPLQPILDLWEALIKADPSVRMPPLGPGHVRAIAVALRNYAKKG